MKGILSNLLVMDRILFGKQDHDSMILRQQISKIKDILTGKQK